MRQNISDILIRKMTLDDLQVVLLIDRTSFQVPWTERSYRFELTKNPAAHLLVAEVDNTHPRMVIGFIGCWLMEDEVHISTIAVHPDYRRQGVGNRLLMAMLDLAEDRGGETATLEVRMSNQAAVGLYQKNGFVIGGRKACYYRDNNEDALLMTLSTFNNK